MKDYLNEAYTDLLVEMNAPLLWVTLNRPQCSNAFSDEMITELCRLFREADWDDDVRVIILTGAGNTFCAGGDVKAMEEKTGMFAGDPEGLMRRYTRGASNRFRSPSRPCTLLSWPWSMVQRSAPVAIWPACATFE